MLLLATVDVSNAQVSIKERVGIRASRSNKLDVDSTGKYMPGEEAISPRINKSMQTTGAMITVPDSSYVTIAVVSADAASTIDLILRSPLNETVIPDASGNVGATWESPFFPTEAVLDVGIFWVWRNYSGYEYGVEMTHVAEHEYILYFEDLGDLYDPYIDYDDLVVDVRIHGKPDHLNVTVDPDSIFYGGYTDITAVAIDNEGNEMSLGDNAMMTLSAEPSSIGSFYPSNEVFYGDLRNGYVSYLADQEQPTCMQDVVVTVSGEGASGTANVVVKESPCMVMSTSSDKIHPGESVDITMQQLDCSGNLMPYPADQYFYIWMNSDPKYGKLRDQSGNEDWFVEGVQPFTFVAADSIDVDTTVVDIEAWAWSGGGGASRIAGVGVKDTLGNPPIASTTLNATLMKLAKLEEKLKKRLAEVKAAAPVPSGPVPSSVKYANAQANTKNKLTITSEGVTDCRSVVHVTIKGPELVILDHSPWSIWPSLPPTGKGESRGADRPGYNPKRSFRIQVTDGKGRPLANREIEVTIAFEEQSGGHLHGFGEVQFPQGVKQGVFYGQGGQGANPISLTTDQNGTAVIDSFLASQVSGKYLVTASLVSSPTIRDTINLEVKVPGLVNFRDLIVLDERPFIFDQTPTGGANHPSNTWCTPNMGDSLFLAILDFYIWTQTEKGGGTPIQTSINDMSLSWGGYFDINANFDIESPSHSFHRGGLSVDINPGAMHKDQIEYLTKCVKQHHGIKNKERLKIHYAFDGGN